MLNILIANWTKAFVGGYVISKSRVKQNFLVVIDYFKNVHLERFQEKKKVSQETVGYYFNKRVNHINYQFRFLISFLYYEYVLDYYYLLINNKLTNT